MKRYESITNIFVIILALLLVLITATPAMAASGNAAGTEHSTGNGDTTSSGVFGQGKSTQTTLSIIFGFFLVVIILVAVIAYILFTKKRDLKSPEEHIKEDYTNNPYINSVSSDEKSTPPGFPVELNSKYSDVQLIGTGGLSYVFSAKSKETEKTVAVKVPIQKDEKSGSIFLQEIEIWKGLIHPNIVSIKSVNVFPVPYVEMEYITDSLADLKFPLKPDIALHIAAGILRGLSYAHNKGIIHCDIKPGNILIDDDFTPRITDWSLGKHIGTVSEVSGYTPAFAAPEQKASGINKKCTVRTDIYQTGMLLYLMLSGKKPSGKNLIPDNPLPESGDEEIDYKYSDINRIVMKCIQNDPYMRYSNVDELLSEILSAFSSTVII